MIFDIFAPPQGPRGRIQKSAVVRPIHLSNSHTKFSWILSNDLGRDSVTDGQTDGQTDKVTNLLVPPQGPRGRGIFFAVARPMHVSNSHTKFGWISYNVGRTEAIAISPSLFLIKREDNKHMPRHLQERFHHSGVHYQKGR